ncbi:acyltransferase family protein [Butyrivibrio sp. VCB2006]|uniref:acyltransferase family protein n=1 Tax=Butyrivibrio sp. VCB2006 TaxID=1280679 RepID=UPI0012DC8CAA|nr:acyltransferase [Butyrivibrio sp. VCB2006]
MKKKNTYVSLQFLRAFAFLGVFASHNLIADDVFSRWGVAIFFILSGFLNALHDVGKDDVISAKSSFEYATKKVKKIYKLHVIMTFIALFLWVISDLDKYLANMAKEVVLSVIKLATNLLLISDFLPSSGFIGQIFSEYNIVSWYLSASFFFYLLTPALVKITKRINKPLLISGILFLLTMIIDVLLVSFLGTDSAFWYIYECPILRLSDYMIGIQMGYLYASGWSIEGKSTAATSKGWILLGLGVIGSLALLCVGQVKESPIRWFINSGFYFTIPAVLLIFSLTMLNEQIEGLISKNKALRSIVILGNLSAYAYLIHVPVINLVHGVYKRFGTVNLYVWCLISLVLTIVLSVLAKERVGTHKNK